jgi:N-formylglutamate deformylase
MKLPFIISLPHCSGRIPDTIGRKIALTPEEMVDTIDLGTLEIFGNLPAEAVLAAKWSRLVADLNRPPWQRDAKGPVALVDYHGRSIYGRETIPDEDEIQMRLSAYYHPYHRQLEKALGKAHIKGLLDCHSLQDIGPPEAPDAGQKRKDIILGNNGGPGGECDPLRGDATCTPTLLRHMARIFETEGLSVSINAPYAGGFIAAHYGAILASRGKVALQIEINQALYVDPKINTVIPERAARVRNRMLRCLSRIGEML